MKRLCAIGALGVAACGALACSEAREPSHVSNAGTAGNASMIPAGGGPMLGVPPIIVPGPAVPDPPAMLDLGATCDPSRVVDGESQTMLVNDPELLRYISLERVLRQLIDTAEVALEPLELLQRLFDTESNAAAGAFADNVHCDDPLNPAFGEFPAVECPRAEARLALSPELFSDTSPDGFYPVALINRFDLISGDMSTCGSYGVVFAKRSGQTDANDRVFLSLQVALSNPVNSIAACRPITQLWVDLATSDDTEKSARTLEQFFFEGVADFRPLIHASGFLSGLTGCSGGYMCGRVQLGQGMQAPYQFRQFELRVGGSQLGKRLFASPVPVQSSPRTAFFDASVPDASGAAFRSAFVGSVFSLVGPDVTRMFLSASPAYNGGESAVAGAAAPSYLESALAGEQLSGFLAQLGASIPPDIADGCPSEDPLDGSAVVRRAAAQSCAGCHAPQTVISPDGQIGCGLGWPRSLGTTHIDELGELSPGLRDVYLPHRARLFSIYLQACDQAAIIKDLGINPPVVDGPRPECFPAGTPITMADGSRRPIEAIEPGEQVLSFDSTTRALASATVARRIVRLDAERHVLINGALTATDNHPFFTERGWRRAEQLAVGDRLLQAGFDEGGAGQLGLAPRELASIEMRPGSGPTYNLDVAVHHSYFADGLLVHDRP